MTFGKKLQEIWKGKDIYRILMNEECENILLEGKVVDVGSGKQLASYHRFLRKGNNVVLECLDLGFDGNSSNGGKQIDLEKDMLPYADNSVDTVLLFNVLEHIYNYEHLLREIKRILKPRGKLIGAVPFLVSYHPDPHDYWRYTGETLSRIFSTIGFSTHTISPFGHGPFTAGFSQTEGVIPRILKCIFLPCAFLCDRIVAHLKPKLTKQKFHLGLFFIGTK